MKKVKQFMTEKRVEKWIKENKDFVDDYFELCESVLSFHVKWGIEIGLILKNPKEEKGRELGVGIVERLFDMQKYTNRNKV